MWRKDDRQWRSEEMIFRQELRQFGNSRVRNQNSGGDDAGVLKSGGIHTSLTEELSARPSAAESVQQEVQLVENSFVLKALESFILRCPRDVAPHTDLILDLSLEYLRWGAFSVLKKLVIVLPNSLSEHMASLVPGIEKALNVHRTLQLCVLSASTSGVSSGFQWTGMAVGATVSAVFHSLKWWTLSTWMGLRVSLQTLKAVG